MKSRIFCLQMILCLFAFLGSGQGQGCGGWMTPHYSVYSTLSANSTTIYSSVSVDGYTSGVCPIGCACSGVTHTPSAYNLIGGTGGWGNGTSVPWNYYLTYTNSKSIAASSVLQPFTSSGKVICTAVGTFFATADSTDYSATNPNCGGTNGQKVIVYAPPQSQRCDGTTTYKAGASVGSSGTTYVTEIGVTTTTDNTLLLDLVGGPAADPVCTNKPGSSTWCYQQSYKAAVPNSSTGRTGNIKWNFNIFCGTKLNPDIYGTVPQPFSCQ